MFGYILTYKAKDNAQYPPYSSCIEADLLCVDETVKTYRFPSSEYPMLAEACLQQQPIIVVGQDKGGFHFFISAEGSERTQDSSSVIAVA
jgi:hypothetical protein